MYILILCFIVGAGFIVYSVINFHGKPQESENPDALYVRIEEKLEAFGQTISEADSTMLELDDKSHAILRELDDKYRELLFLYNMIDEKNGAQAKAPEAAAPAAPKPRAPRVDIAVDDRTRRTRKRLNNPRQQKILEMQEEGMGLSEIAKKMNMGKGEVSLILELGKDGERNA